jgi:uncharacterized Zn finger protein
VHNANAANNGDRYWRQGRVLSLNSIENEKGVQLKARVQGSRRQPYTQTIEIADMNGEFVDIELVSGRLRLQACGSRPVRRHRATI